MEEFKKYILDINNSNSASQVGKFWKGQHKVSGFKNELDFIPSDENIKNLRTWSARTAMGNGGSDQIAWGKQSYGRLLKAFPDKQKLADYINNLNESDVGNPVRVKTDLGNFSGMFYLNIIQSYALYTAISNFYTTDKPLDICEIGAGWGQCCEILNQKLSLSSYTTIDLKETLVLSYLNALHNFDNSDIQLIMNEKQKKYNFCVPENIDNLENSNNQYDIFINCYSFQEMSKQNVISYTTFIKKKLKKDGLFISINSWGYDRYEIKHFSDLQLHNFEIVDIFNDPRSIGCKQLVVVCKNVEHNKEINIDKLNRMALDLRNNKIKKEDFLNNIYI